MNLYVWVNPVYGRWVCSHRPPIDSRREVLMVQVPDSLPPPELTFIDYKRSEVVEVKP